MQYTVKKKVLCSAEKGSVIWAEGTVEVWPNSSAKPNFWSVTTTNIIVGWFYTQTAPVQKVVSLTLVAVLSL